MRFYRVSVLLKMVDQDVTIENTPSITIQSDEGENSTAIAYVNGVKNINLIYGGVGYSPLVLQKF